jgi:hypothetical protein
MGTNAAAWPSLEGAGMEPTLTSLHLWGQIVGKTRLALSQPMNHWWHVPFYVTARGLGTSPMPVGGMVFDVELDLLSHELAVRTSEGARQSIHLCDVPLAGFYSAYMDALRKMGVDLTLYPFTVEMPEKVRLDRDPRPCHYDPDWATRFFRALVQADRLLKEFRGRFVGKASPVHFFWGGFDLAATRFSGRPAPRHPGGIPNVGDWVMREAYSHEVSSAGFWPGDPRYPATSRRWESSSCPTTPSALRATRMATCSPSCRPLTRRKPTWRIGIARPWSARPTPPSEGQPARKCSNSSLRARASCSPRDISSLAYSASKSR